MIRWDIKSAQDGAGGAEALRVSDNLCVPSRTTVLAARRAWEKPTAFVVCIPAAEERP